jgi:hypothetical protein
MKIGYVAANLGSPTSGVVTCTGSSFLGAVEGIIERVRLPYSVTTNRTDSMLSNNLHHVASLKT